MSLTLNSNRLLKLTGFQPKRLFRNLKRLPRYLHDYRTICAQSRESLEPFELGNLFPVLDEQSRPAGSARGHYFHQDLHVARLIHQKQPERHIDVGSRVDGFVAHIAAFRDIEVVDVRSLKNDVPGITFHRADLMQELPSQLVNATDSLSCLHALEHFGLGRYGDPLDFEGHRKGLQNLHRMLTSHGTLYLSAPISSRQRIEFNAHRVFSIPYLLALFEPQFEVQSFAYVNDDGCLRTDVARDDPEIQESFGLNYGCGIFELQKRPSAHSNAG